MGSQTNFFLTPNDLASLEKALRSAGELNIIGARAEAGRIEFLENLGQEMSGAFLVRPQDLPAVRLRDLSSQSYKTIDGSHSAVVEFGRGRHVGDKFRRGRMYVESAYFEGETLVRKSEDFLRWSARLMRIARRKLRKDPASFFYYGEEAWGLRDSNIQFL